MRNTDGSAEEWVDNEDAMCRDDRIQRLLWLVDQYPQIDFVAFPGGILTKQLFEEARYSFVYAQFTASILLVLAFIERCLAAHLYAAGRDDLARASLSALSKEAYSLGLLNDTEVRCIEHLRKTRNALAHFREPGDVERIEARSVRSLYEHDHEPMTWDEVIASDAVSAIRLLMHFMQRFAGVTRSGSS